MSDYSSPRWQFASVEEFVDYIANLTEVEPESRQLIRLTRSQVKSLDTEIFSDRPIIYDNPVLNYITSEHGELVVGNRSIAVSAQLSDDVASNNLFASGYPVLNAQATTCTTDNQGLEFCYSDDGRVKTYYDGNVFVAFRTFEDSGVYSHEIGTRIRVYGGIFTHAAINSRYYQGGAQTCHIADTGFDEDANDDVIKESVTSYGVLPSNPFVRLESLCRVQWNGYRRSGIVWKGNDCFNVSSVDPWPDGYPDDWPLPETPEPKQQLLISPGQLIFTSLPSQPSITKTFTIKNTFFENVPVTVEGPTIESTSDLVTPNLPYIGIGELGLPDFGGDISAEFTSSDQGQFTLPPNQSKTISVTFSGNGGYGTVIGRIRVSYAEGGSLTNRDVPLLGKIMPQANSLSTLYF